jgi:hypothetical protein
MGVTAMRLLTIGTPKSLSIERATATRSRAWCTTLE